MDCDTTGIEPDFALVKYKKLAGGGYFKLINQSVPIALKNLGYTDDEIIGIDLYLAGRRTLSGCSGMGITKEKLLAKGYTEAQCFSIMSRVEPNAFSLQEAFSDFPSLFTDFSPEEIEYAENYFCGMMTLEGCQFLKPEHLPIFDTASLCGKYGTRVISWDGHLQMMAAVQPFVSGAISKTINMPSTASYLDIEKAYMQAWASGVKSITVYRDKSKLSQPLSSFSGNTDMLSKAIFAASKVDEPVAAPIKEEKRIDPHDILPQKEVEALITAAEPKKEVEKKVVTTASATEPEKEPFSEVFMRLVAKAQEEERVKAKLGNDIPNNVGKFTSRRIRLPSKRKGYIQKSKIAGHSLFLHTGEYEDGKLGEIFIDMHREGAAFRSLLNSFAIAISLGLQYGVPLEEFVDAFVYSRFEPNGMVQGHQNIKMVTSVIDYIFRDLAINYLGRTDLAQVKPEDLQSTSVKTVPKEEAIKDEPREEKGDISLQDIWSELKEPLKSILGSAIPKQPREEKSSPAVDEMTDELKTLPMKETILKPDESQRARMKGYEGDPCPYCGSFTLIRNGTCMKCDTCGNTTGCS
jgi:ribonucleoside-diphosphate reductase alpha chain